MFFLTFIVFCRAVVVLDLRNVDPSARVAIQSAVGLENRDAANVYTISGKDDVFWMKMLPKPHTNVEPMVFLSSALKRRSCILFDAEESFAIPAAVTYSGLLDAILLEKDLYVKSFPGATVVMNLIKRWGNEVEAHAELSQHVSKTTALAFQQSQYLANGKLVDFIVSRRLFSIYLSEMCVPFTRTHNLLKKLVEHSNWTAPIKVFGYNHQDKIFGAYPFEASTNCINKLGTVASDNSTNLSFWSAYKKIGPKEVLLQSPEASRIYDASKTYVALVYGDMDNIAYIQTFGRKHMQRRAKRCKKGSCFPLTWTMSPIAVDILPEALRWYYRSALKNGKDWFILPPSGYLYSYPGLMSSSTQESFVRLQNLHSFILNTSASVHWELLGTWSYAMGDYFPRYAGGTHSFFLNNVPWFIPISSGKLYQQSYQWLDEARTTVLFKPAFNWSPGLSAGGFSGNPSEAAARINALSPGVHYVYVIQNTDIDLVFNMTEKLGPHVELVGYQGLVEIARQMP